MSDTPAKTPPPLPPRPTQSSQTGSTGHESVSNSEPKPQDGTGDDKDVALRHITFWRNGFSIGDGPLIRYDQPESTSFLRDINAGLAPPRFLNVRVGQPVELLVYSRVDEDYVPPPAPSSAAVGVQTRRSVPIAPSINAFLRR